MRCLSYAVAGFTFRITDPTASLVPQNMPAFAKFWTLDSSCDFEIEVVENDFVEVDLENIDSYDWYEAVCTLFCYTDGYLWQRQDTGSGVIDRMWWDRRAEKFYLHLNSMPRPHIIDLFLLIAFNYATLSHKTLVLHSSVVECNGKGYLFLGESGTGKSTHTKLWLNTIPGATMLNDDAPIVRVLDGCTRVYGSPWSGKGRCYRNEHFEIGGIYRLSQAAYNKLVVLNNTTAFAALLPSCLPPLMQVEAQMDLVCETLSEIITYTRQYHLECLPDAEAAQVSYNQTVI